MFRHALAGLAILLTLTACGSGDNSDEEAAERAERRERAAERAEAEQSERIEQHRGDCEEIVTGLATALEALNSRLGVGLVYQDYLTEVGNVAVAYDQTDFASVPDPYCINAVAVPLETARNKYAEAARLWNECISDYMNCNFDEDRAPQVQQLWSESTAEIQRSDTALTEYPDPDEYVAPAP